MITKTAPQNVSDLLAVLDLLEEMNSASTDHVAETAQRLIVVVKESKFDKELELSEARLGLQQYLNKLMCEKTQDSMRRAKHVEILDQEAREQLGFSILPITRFVEPRKAQTIRLNLLNKISENVSTGVDLTQAHNIVKIVESFKKDPRLQTLCTEEDVIVEFLLDILFRK
jgi:hypothetical protein